MFNRTKIYLILLKLYPARFREEYGSPMARQFQDEYARAANRRERLLLWFHAIVDLCFSLPAENARELRQDLRHAFRVYRGRRWNAVMAVVALGLGIGASTGIFSVLNALLVRGLPFRDPRELVELRTSPFGAGQGRAGFEQWRRGSGYLESAATFSVAAANLVNGRDALRVRHAETSANFFGVLGTGAAIGRVFAPSEDMPGRMGVAVISYRLWQQAYGGTPSAIGALLRLDGAPYTIAGVAPPAFDYPGKTDVWTPTVFAFEQTPRRGAFIFQTIGRLKTGVSIPQARRDFEVEAQQVQAQMAGRTSRGAVLQERNLPRMISIRDQLAGPVGQAAWVLGGMIFLLLLTAFANVAQLLLSRTTERRQELAVRAALGASRARLIQQLITEGMALTFAGAALGLAVAEWICRLASSIAPATLVSQSYTIMEWHVLLFAVALAVLMGAVFGVMPALRAGSLQAGALMMRATPDTAARKTRVALVAVQAGLSLILLVGSISMGRTFLRLLDRDLGYRTDRVVTMTVSLQGTPYRGGDAEWRYYSTALDRIEQTPGVEAAGAVSYIPLGDNVYMAGAFSLDSGQTVRTVVINATMPGYFRAMGTPFIAGRDFTAAPPQTLAHSVIVNEEFAARAGLGAAILGRMVKSPWTGALYQVVGVVKTASLSGPQYSADPQIFWQIEEEPPPALTFVARVSGNAEDYLAPFRDALHGLDPQVPIYDVTTLDQRLSTVLARPRFYTTATLFLAALAALLALIGIYGVTSYSILQRTQEVGVRMALGATYRGIRVMMIRENVLPVACGLIPGVAVALASGRLLAHLMENTPPPRPFICVLAAGLLLACGALASWIASAKVLAIEPALAVRTD